MRKLLRWLVAIAAVLLFGVVAYVYWMIERQGLPRSFWVEFRPAKVEFDDDGIPTIEAGDWGTLIFAQGYVTASERLWQMDLIRRKASGRLSELFGERAVEHDIRVATEDRLDVARRGHALLPTEERYFCENYARGVNQFIKDHPRRWGIEFAVFGKKPEDWSCADSLLVLMEMAETLSGFAEGEARQHVWREKLSPAWENFLFSMEQPWSKPLFGQPVLAAPPLPPVSERLPRQPIDATKIKEAKVLHEDPPVIGSNNWAWRGATGAFLANDPHLGNNVPSIWMANRLRVTADDWVVGVAIPGMPGIVIGMNPSLAWAFTNTGEDVDDYLKEQLDETGAAYLATKDEQGEHWRNVEKKTFEIKVRGESEPRKIEGLFTHRGPMSKRAGLGDGMYSRQWLPLKDGMLRLPTMALPRAQSVEALNRALDDMRTPAQNVVFVDGEGNMGYRVSGTGVLRKMTGRVPQDAVAGEWLGFEPYELRRRLLYAPGDGDPRTIATANERIWVDDIGHAWSGEDRKERITRFLGERADFTRKDMEKLHHDTQSRFRQHFLRWIASKAHGAPEAWTTWDGSSRSDPLAFAQSTVAEDALMKLILDRVREAFFKDDPTAAGIRYQWSNRRAWLLSALDTEEGVGVFGLDATETAEYLLKVVKETAATTEPHPQGNRWAGQHPLAEGIPVLGKLFAVHPYPQWGAYDLVNAEGPHHGPSVRLVWDLKKPWESTWSFPVGMSGHIGSRHYRDLQVKWFAELPLPVFDEKREWRFAGRSK